MAMESDPIQALEKTNRQLQKQLARAERNLEQLHRSRQQAEALLSKTIQELQESRTHLEQRGQQLETALADVQAMQSRLMMTEKMSALGILVAGVAHEINNPVSFIYGNIRHIDRYIDDLFSLIAAYASCHPSPPPPVQTCLAEIDFDFLAEDLPKLVRSMDMGAERIKQIVLSLRNFSRMDEAAYKTVDLHEGLDSSLVILAHRLKANGDRGPIQVRQNYGNLPPVTCYAGQINQVFINLLSNAIDALEEKPPPEAMITITTDWTVNHCRIEIADNGPGIPAAVQPKIFDPFFTTKTVGKGTGMGLSISYQIVVEKHQGQLLCESIGGQGTKFTIQLPLQPSQPGPIAPPTGASKDTEIEVMDDLLQ